MGLARARARLAIALGASLTGCVDWDAYRFRAGPTGDAGAGCGSDDAAPVSIRASSGADWMLRWHDEFSGTALDGARWSAADWCSNASGAQECYAPGAATVEGGCLRIHSTAQSLNGRAYASGFVSTRSSSVITYGRIEVRARVPRGEGLFPSLQLHSHDGSWPPGVTIAELFGQEPNVVRMVSYWGTSDAPQSVLERFTGPDFSLEFHDFALEWEPGALRWSIDGAERFHTSSTVPAVPMDLAISTALGGAGVGSTVDTTALPQTFLVDYVRVYGR